MALTRPRAYQIYDIDYKQAVRVVTVSNISLTLGAPNSVDGVNLSVNDRVLVTGQSNPVQNGIYYVTTLGTGSNGTWSRSTDTNTTGELLAGTIVMVTEGTTYADTQWKLTTDDPITIGSTALTFVPNGQANSISSGSSNVIVNTNADVTVSSAGTSNVFVVSSTGANVAGYLNSTGNITGGNFVTAGKVYGLELISTQSLGDEGGQISLALAATNTTLTGNVIVDVYQNKLRFFEDAGTNRGAYIDLSQANAGVGTNLLESGGGGTPGGSNTNVQFNDSGVFGGDGQFTYDKVTNTLTAGAFTATGNITGGNLLGTSIVGTVTTAAQPNITSVGTLSSLAVTGNITGGNVNSTFYGSGAGLTSIPAANVTGTLSVNTTGYAATVSTAAQPNITSVGTLSSLAVTGNITGGNFVGTLNGSGANVTLINANNLAAGTVPSARLSGTYTITVSGSATTAGTVTTAAQPNITSVGTLSSLAVTGNITGGNLITAGVVTASSLQSNVATGTAPLTVTSTTRVANLNVSYSNVADYISSSTALSGLYYITLINALGANVQPLGNASLTVNAANGALFATSFNGSGAGLTSIPAANVTGTLSVNTTGYAATVSTAAQPNITSVGTLSSLIVSGTFSSGAHTITGSPLTAIVNGGTAGVGNIGASGQGFNTVFAKATSAQYADLAEYYSSDRNYEPGTVVVFGGNAEITQSEQDADNTVAGVVSTNPAYIMNAGIQSAHSVPVALTGRVPTRVIGPVKKGNMMVSTANGYARACATPQIGTVIGKALENFEGDIGIIEVVVGRI